MEAYQQRVVDERNELHERREKLGTFIQAERTFTELPKQDQELLKEQHDAMLRYEDILETRISRFKDAEPRQPTD